MSADAVAAAVAAFPELRRLVDLRDAGWAFLPTQRDGELIEVHGVRTWPGGWADAIRVRYVTDAAGLRGNYEGGVVWKSEGGLVEVIDGLLTLPAPGDKLAPHLVRGIAPQLWVPAS